MIQLSKSIFKSIIDLIFPPWCVSCESILPAKRFIICNSCYSNLDIINDDQKNVFLERIETMHFDDLFIHFHFSHLFQKLMHFFKYEGFLEIADYFSYTIINSIENKYDIITCVPLHLSKKKERGFNQSEILSQKVCRLLGMEHTIVLERNRYTESQTKLSRQERKENMKDAFSCIINVENKSILLIDDVITTGSTLNECARVLKTGGAKIVDVFAMATPVDILQERLESGRL